MKKLICALLSVLLITPCMANIHIRSEAVEAVIKQKISNLDAQVAALAEYNAQIKNAGGKNAGVPAAGIWSVCTAAGWDIKTVDGKSKCTDFGNALMKYANWNFRAVCDKDKFMAERGTGRCIDNVFSNKVISGVKVNMLIATGLAKEYARVKYNDNNLICSKNPRKTTLPPDDYIQCISMDKNMAYEFKFDSVTATNDAEINAGTETGICKIYDLKYSLSGSQQATYLGNGQKVGDYESWPAACETTDAKVCSKINESMKRFGRSAQIGTTGSKGNKHNACVIKGDGITPTTLRTAFGIDNHAFKKGGIQLNATTAVKTQVCDWVKKTVTNPTITSCVCNDGFTQMYDFSSLITETDDVLTCTINGKPVDFVFDDLSEANKKVAAGGVQGMDCMAAGGTYSGQRCINLNAEQCELLAGANIKNCPNCKRVKFDPKTNSCVLPSSADAANIQKNTNIALIVGGAVVGVGVTVMTGGAGAVVVLTGIETVGAAIELGAQIKIDAIADEFLVKSNQCKSASCAEELIKEHLQRMSNIANDMQPAERNAVDKELARLLTILPDTSQILVDIVGGESLIDANHKSLFDSESWEPGQVWRAVGIALQMTSIFGAVGKWVLTKAGVLSKTLPEATIQLTSKTKLTRTQISKILSEGKPVKLRNGGEIKIPKSRLAAPIDETLELHDMRLINQEFSRIDANRSLSATQKIQQKQAVLRDLMYSDQGSTRFIESTMTYRKAMAESLAEDPQLFQYMDNFETLSDAQKQDFANKLVKKIESKLCDGTSCSNVYVGNFQRGADGNIRFSSYPTNVGIRGSTGDGNIYINATGKSSNLYAPEQGIVDNTKVEGFLSTLAHEHDHAIGNINPGTAGISQVATEFAEYFIKNGETNIDNLLEQSAYIKEYSVSSGIVDAVKDLRHSSPQPAPIRHTVGSTANISSVLQSAKSKLYTYGTDFDKVIDDFLHNDGGYPVWWKMSDLTPAEHNALKSFLNDKGITLTTETLELNGVQETFYRLNK